MDNSYTKTSRGVRLLVTTWYDEPNQDFLLKSFTHVFRISMTNERHEPVRLMLRRWMVNELHQEPRVWEGSGFEGRLPLIQPGHTLTYEVRIPFSSPSVKLRGAYIFQSTESGELIEVISPSFAISAHVFN